jgi:hypothetical protein
MHAPCAFNGLVAAAFTLAALGLRVSGRFVVDRIKRSLARSLAAASRLKSGKDTNPNPSSKERATPSLAYLRLARFNEESTLNPASSLTATFHQSDGA